MHMYRDVHEYHDGCYYCAYRPVMQEKMKKSTHPPLVCEGCPRGEEGAYETIMKGNKDGEKGRKRV